MSEICLPFLKWAGGKRSIASALFESFPSKFFENEGKFFEPFVGGGALSLSLGSQIGFRNVPGARLNINDMNPDLIAAYRSIRDELPELLEILTRITNEFDALPGKLEASQLNATEEEQSRNKAKDFDAKTKAQLAEEKKEFRDPLTPATSREQYFYKMREREYATEVEKAARLIFLNKTCFNGLWRVNAKGKFNVPYGHHKKPRIFDQMNLELCSLHLQGSHISNLEFFAAVENATQYDLVYFDPPYIPLTPTASFSQYSKNDFGKPDHLRLAQTIRELTERGVYVILSNSDTPITREIFGEVLSLRQISMSRFISAQSHNRKPVFELIGTNFELNEKSPLASLDKITF